MQQMIFIADLISCSICFGHHYAHHQELEIIIQVVAVCGIWCFGFQVVGMVRSWGLCVRFVGSIQLAFYFHILKKFWVAWNTRNAFTRQEITKFSRRTLHHVINMFACLDP